MGDVLRRLGIYFREMFPPLVNVPGGLLLFASFYLLCQRAGSSIGPLRLGLDCIYGAATVVLGMLMARVFDEFKDLETDKSLFPSRPVPSGRVKVSDVKLVGWLCAASLVALNVWHRASTAAFAAWFALLLLTWRWFFLPKVVPNNLILVAVTHQPLVPALFIYVYSVYLDNFAATADLGVATLLVGAYWAPMLSWELARKIRAPHDETDYKTYSKVLGPRVAAILTASVIGFGTFLLVVIANRLALSTAFAVAAIAAGAVVVALFARFVVTLSSRAARLKPIAEAYILVVQVGILVELALGPGIRFA